MTTKKTEMLDLDDFDAAPKLKEITLLGKTAYLRELSFDDQMFIGDWKGDQKEGSKLALALCLCKADGTKMFSDVDVAMKKLGNINVSDIWTAIQSAQQHSGVDKAAAKKKSSRTRGKPSK